MKKIFMIVLLLGIQNSYTQSILSVRLASMLNTQNREIAIGPGISLQMGSLENISLGFNFDYQFWIKTNKN